MSPVSTFSSLTTVTITGIFLMSVMLCANNVSGYKPVDDSKDLVISFSEKKALDKLKSQVMEVLPEDFMRNDFYLIRWVRMANLNVADARAMLIKNLQWRAKHNISQLMDENWADMEQDYRCMFGGRDKKGRPVGSIDLGEWDLLGAVLSGRKPRLQQYLRFTTEKGIRELFQAQRESTKPITRGTILVDGEGGSIRNLCPACIAILYQWIREMELYYPKFIREIIVINAPSVTDMALKALRPAMSQETSDIIHIFNLDKRVWMEYLDRFIDRSQRLPRYGGTRKD